MQFAMMTSSNYRSPLELPNGTMQTPVSVGDLPSFAYQAPVEIVTENVTSHLEAHPEIPGVILLQNGQLHSALPRALMFERLGHRYGVELFLRKPILELQQNLGIQTFTISSNMGVKEAVRFALRREPEYIYAPLVIHYDDGQLRLLDMHVLLYAQSHILDNANNVLGSMKQIEDAIHHNMAFEQLMDLIVDAISRVVPNHRTGIFIKPSRWMELPSRHNLIYPYTDSLTKAPAFKSVVETCQPLHILDAGVSSHWQGMKSLGKFRAWMGVPVKSVFGCEGVLSLGRFSLSPFSEEETQLAKSFSEFIGVALHTSSNSNAALFQLERARHMTDLWVGTQLSSNKRE
jgi:hypothetical protein